MLTKSFLMDVKVWKETKIIPTYEIGTPELYPVFLEKRVYQASSGKVYPHPVIEHISDIKVDKEWEVIYLENDYVKIMILPALGGRIQMAFDKIRNRHFIYYNQVIKPALVGLTGPWISGGIEFNWPQHHRPSTYEPTEHHIKKNEDGSVTVWVSEVERMFRTKGMAGFTLYPDKAYLEIKAKLYNRTPHPQTFLWWANPAVKVNDHYQSVFPPDVHAVFDHGKRDVSEFPIAKGTYYKVDYSPGTDISRYKNIPVPTSYMAITSNYDFVGGYENDSKGGLLHVANHHISPGKKQWTWGNGDFGKAWDRNLTDEDGPYIELMCGVYTDNQPDFSWLHPYEEKSFEQYFMPYYNVGVVKNATKEALVNIELVNDTILIKCHVTSEYPEATIVLSKDGKVYYEDKSDLSPTGMYEQQLDYKGKNIIGFQISIKTINGKELVCYQVKEPPSVEKPDAAKAIAPAEEIESIEELYLSGLHLEQYRHATYDPTSYYQEALRRSPGDVRNNNALGLWYLKHGRFSEALPYFDRAIVTLTEKNPNPYDGEAFFHRGLTLVMLGRDQEGYASLYKASWNAAWQDAAYFQLARLEMKSNNIMEAGKLIDKALSRNCNHHLARHLKIVKLRLEDKKESALYEINAALELDYFSFGIHFEKYLLTKIAQDKEHMINLMEDRVHNYLESALEYAHMGRYEEAIQLLMIYNGDKKEVYPMVKYFMGYFYLQLGNKDAAKENFTLAEKMPMDYCFPNRLEEVTILQAAIKTISANSRANYYLGNFYYAHKQYGLAKEAWESSIAVDSDNSYCHRNLSLHYFNKEKNEKLTRLHLEKAFELNPDSARLLMELDQFYKKINLPIKERIEILDNHFSLVQERDDIYLEYISILNLQGRHQEALDMIMDRTFHPWEGGEGKVVYQYLNSLVELSKAYLQNGQYAEAIKALEKAKVYPENLGEGKLYGTQENDIDYWIGCTYDRMGLADRAKENWQLATIGPDNPSPAIFYNDQQPDKLFYKALALDKLGHTSQAQQIFTNLINYGKDHLKDDVRLDYFAISLPDLLIWEEDLNITNSRLCKLLMGLGNLGLGNLESAKSFFDQILIEDRYYTPARLNLEMVNCVNENLYRNIYING